MSDGHVRMRVEKWLGPRFWSAQLGLAKRGLRASLVRTREGGEGLRTRRSPSSPSLLTDVRLLMVLDVLRQFEVARDDRHLQERTWR